ncbi:MAG: hydrogenase nickel incorporation protein HypB [Actinomycetota bacterium]|nr:hydrogenase nickel incorporation protein HypB [Actinomycetota bacterium]
MCATCGCGDDGGVRVIDLRPGADIAPHAHPHPADHTHPHPADHTHPHPAHAHPLGDESAERNGTGTETLTLQARVLAKNDGLAGENRGWLRARGLVAVNLMSSPGSGKTSLLERTVRAVVSSNSPNSSVCVVEGDQETTFDAERILAAGAPVLQVNTGSGCHLDAAMLRTALQTLDPTEGLVLIENVGNLVCPALFDLGEDARVVIMSVTEGADKPLKYPQIFAAATAVVLNKIDLLPYVDFDVARFERDVRLVNPRAVILHVSATRGDGLPAWFDWLSNAAATCSASSYIASCPESTAGETPTPTEQILPPQ